MNHTIQFTSPASSAPSLQKIVGQQECVRIAASLFSEANQRRLTNVGPERSRRFRKDTLEQFVENRETAMRVFRLEMEARHAK